MALPAMVRIGFYGLRDTGDGVCFFRPFWSHRSGTFVSHRERCSDGVCAILATCLLPVFLVIPGKGETEALRY